MKSKVGALVSQMYTHQAKTEANQEELVAAVKASQERMEALMDVSLEIMEACLEEMKVETIGGPIRDQ
jgi:cell fate (sporulation/competence/biofilm development) regulator YlbF (YheA/YmcA/DUF963 family)